MKNALRQRQRVLALLLVALIPAVAAAQLPSPRLDRVQPLGLAAGASIELTIQGGDLEDAKQLVFDHPALRAEFVNDNVFKVSAAADAPAGTYDTRALGRFGLSNPRLLAVHRGLRDVREKEPNDGATAAQPLDLNVAVAGVSDGEGQDVYLLTLKAGQRVTAWCQAMRLDVPMDATLTLNDPTGKLLASNSDYHGRDPLIDHTAAADGPVLLTVADLSYRGGFPYLLLVSDRPHVDHVFPNVVEPGKPVQLSFFGRNLGAGAANTTMGAPGAVLQELRQPFTPGGMNYDFMFLEHPTDHSPLPTAATCTLAGQQTRLMIGEGALNAATLMHAEGAVTRETEPNDASDKPQAVTLPATIAGRFEKPRDSDWYSFTTAEGGNYAFEAYCERIAGQADPYIMVLDDQGNRVGELDDFGHRMNAFDGHLRDPVGVFGLQPKKTYRVLVQDRYRRGGPRLHYVLCIRPMTPDFYAASMHAGNPVPNGLNLWRGGTAHLDIVVHQRDGFPGPFTVHAVGLPGGVHSSPSTFHNTGGLVVLWADAGAAPTRTAVRFEVEGVVGGKPVRRPVRPYTRVAGDIGSSRPTRAHELAVINEPAPFIVRLEPESVTIEAGKKVELKCVVQRLAPDFKSAVKISPAPFATLNPPTVEIPADKNEIALSFEVPAGHGIGPCALIMLAQAQTPYNKNPSAKDRPNVLVTQPCRPAMLTITPKKS